MIRVSATQAGRTGVPLLVLSLSLLAISVRSTERAASAEPTPTPLPTELSYVPADTALFFHVDTAKLWNGTLGKSLRAADAKTFEELAASTKKHFGSTPDALKSITVFWPKLKTPRDPASLGIVLVFNAPYDKKQLKAGIDGILPPELKGATLETPSDTIAVVLANLDSQKYGKPQPAEKTGPLTDALREAGAGKHLLVAGVNLANLPDEIRGDDLPPEARPFQPLLKSDTITAIIDLDKELMVDIRVKAPTPPRAKEAEKALGFLATLAQETLGQGLKELGMVGAKDPAVKDLTTILTTLQTGLKDAKFSTEGEVARVIAKVSADLPIANAYLAAKSKVQEAAARAQVSNNLKQIGISFHNYNDTMGSMPPAAVCDKAGKPMLSWRVLILPYIEANNLYKEFKLDEPWDSDHNKKLIPKMPKIYALPFPTTAKANETHFRVFVGNGAAFDYLKGPRIPADFQDGTSNTLLVVTAKDAVPWTKPDELAFDPDKDMTKLLGFFSNDVCMVGLADGSVRGVSKSISKATLHGAITRNGGEVLGDDF